MQKSATSFITLAVLLLALPGTALALPLDLVAKTFEELKTVRIAELPESLQRTNGEAFCSAFSETKMRLNGVVASKEQNVSEYIDGLAQTLEDERNSRDAKLEEARSEADQRRSVGYARLMEQAENDEEKDAVAKYQQTIEEAVDDRRDSVDAAITEFRKGVDALALRRLAGMRSARDTFVDSFEAAMKKIEADCVEDITGEVLVRDLKAALQSGRNKLAADTRSAAIIAAEMKTLEETQQQSVRAAISMFQLGLDQASEKLQAAFTRD